MSDQDLPDVGPENTDEREAPEAPRASYSRRQQLRATRLEVGGVIGNTFSIWFGNLPAFSALALLIYSPILIITYLFYSGSPTQEEILQFTGITTLAERIFFGSLLTGTVVYGVLMQLRGDRAPVGRCLSIGLSRIFHVFAITFLVGLMCIACFIPGFLFTAAGIPGLGVLLMFVALIPLVIILIMYHVAVPAVVLEQVGVGEALSRSAALTKGSRGTIFGILFIFGLLIAVIAFVYSFILGILASGMSLSTQVLLQGILNVLVTPLWAIIPAVIYHDLRVGKEGVDVKDLAAVFD